MENNLKILDAEIVNFKNLTKKHIEIGGRTMIVVGPNNAGKSTVIQALFAPFLDTYKPLDPVTQGEDKGSLKVKIGGHLEGEEVEYSVEVYFSKENQKGRLVVFNKDGSKVTSPKSALQGIIGDISFDIDRFIQLSKTPSGKHSAEGAKKQVEMLKKFMPKEIQDELSQCDVDRLQFFNDRKDINAQVKLLEGNVIHDYSDEDIKKYSERKSEEEVNQKLGDIGEAIEKWQYVEKGIEQARKDKEECEKIISQKEELKHKFDVVKNMVDSLDQFKNQQETSTFLVHANSYKSKMSKGLELVTSAEKSIPELEEKIKKGDIWIEANPKPTTESLLKEQREINEHNKHADKVAEIRENFEKIRLKKEESEEITKKIEACVARKKKIFADHPLPVKGLSFDEDQVYYKDLPFNFESQPTSTIIGVGLQIAMAMNPNLKALVIKDGSLLDKELYTRILKMCEEKGFQLIIEMVEWEGKELEIQFSEKQA